MGRKLRVYLDTSKSELWKYLNQIEYVTYDVTEDALEVAHQIVTMGVFTRKSFDDCQHI